MVEYDEDNWPTEKFQILKSRPDVFVDDSPVCENCGRLVSKDEVIISLDQLDGIYCFICTDEI